MMTDQAAQPVLERNPVADAYVVLAWELLRDNNLKTGERYSCVHTTYTPFNKLFREVFQADPVAYTKMLQVEGLVDIVLVRGGALLKPNEGLLTEIPRGHRKTVAKIRHLLEAAGEERRKQREEQRAKKAAAAKTDTAAEGDARKAFASGDVAAALKRLGY